MAMGTAQAKLFAVLLEGLQECAGGANVMLTA